MLLLLRAPYVCALQMRDQLVQHGTRPREAYLGCESGKRLLPAGAHWRCCTRAAVVVPAVVDVGVPSESLMRPSPHQLACCIPLCHSDPSRSTILQAAAGLSFGVKCISKGPEVGPLSHHVDRLHAKVGGPPAHLPTCPPATHEQDWRPETTPCGWLERWP